MCHLTLASIALPIIQLELFYIQPCADNMMIGHTDMIVHLLDSVSSLSLAYLHDIQSIAAIV